MRLRLRPLEKRWLRCLRCGRQIWTDSAHRMCRRCRRHNNEVYDAPIPASLEDDSPPAKESILVEVNPQLLYGGIILPDLFGRNWPVWKTVQLGSTMKIINVPEYFYRSIKSDKKNISFSADEIIRKREFTVAKKRIEVDLVAVLLKHLGLSGGAPIDQVNKQANWLGLHLCPPEVGPRLCLQYKDTDHLKGRLLVGMKPIDNLDGNPMIFSLEKDDSMCGLDCMPIIGDSILPANCCLVFVRPHE